MQACPIKPLSNRVKTLTLEELTKEQSTNPHLKVIDVRDLDEWSQGHFEYATHIPLKSLEFIISRGDIPKDTPIICYCASGRRSNIACELFLENGYTNVRNLEGGYPNP